MGEKKQKIIFLGTGTSQGVPVIGSKEPVCLSKNPKDKRLRASVYVEIENTKLLIDCGPDFRQQMLRENLSHLDAILITHEHNDHIIGLDDVRPINFLQKKDMPIYGLPRVLNEIEMRFPYAFSEDKYPGTPSFDLFPVTTNVFSIQQVNIEPLPVYHGKLPILGYKIGDFAYITDVSEVPDSTQELIYNIPVLVIDALRKSPKHHSHFTLDEAIEFSQKIKAKKTYFTHISHRMGFYDEVEKELPWNMHLAFDGLSLEL